VNDVARGWLNEALRDPLKIGGPRLQPCQPSGKSGPAMLDNTDTEYTITSAELLGWLVLLIMASVCQMPISQ